jgi:hypothetical protein
LHRPVHPRVQKAERCLSFGSYGAPIMEPVAYVAQSIGCIRFRLQNGAPRHTRSVFKHLLLSVVCGAGLAIVLPEAASASGDITPLLPPSSVTSSTVPPNKDSNPYGVAFVPEGFPRFGTIDPGDLLVSNFNNQANLQGTGTTIVKIVPNSKPVVFFQGAPALA